jgi:segregation and condensation protein A
VGYQVKTPAFEGPFELLLQLVARQQVDIWELSLASIVDDYLAALAEMEALDLGVATEFLVVAALLLELKVRRLLPEDPGQESEEELALWEERDLLLARLLEGKTFKDASLALERLMAAAELCVPRRAGPEEPFASLAPDPLEGVRPERLRDALLRLLVPKPVARVNTDHVAPIRASVADTLEELVARLPQEGETTFRRLTEGLSERLEVIVYFLAILELYKRGEVELAQAGKLAELRVRWAGAPGPAALAGASAGEERA